MQHGCRRINDAGLADAACAEAVDIEDITLELGRCCPCDCQLGVPVGCAGQNRVKQNLDPLARQVAGGFRKPDIIADRETEPAHFRHVENAEFGTGVNARFVGPEREHLAVLGNDFTGRD